VRTLIVGHGGRESALAQRMGERSELHAFVGHANPSIVRSAQESGGSYAIGDVCDARAVAAFARATEVDVAMVSADEPLAAGVVDALLAQGTRAVGPTRAGAEIEWNKAFARALLDEVAPEAAPAVRVVRRPQEVEEAVASFGGGAVAVMPSGLTGGTGRKVMGAGHYSEACSIIERVIERLSEQGRHFSGVMNSGFFATADGVRVIEFNARFGDPECMNIMSLFCGDWPAAMESISAGSLSAADVPLREEASVVLYLVSPDYALRPGGPYEFALDRDEIEREGCAVFFSSA